MKMTSAQAAKELRRLNDELKTLLTRESSARYFMASIEEDIEDVRPAYDYAETQQKQIVLEEKIRTLKHALNCFNTTTLVPGFDMTIDQMLVYLPQLTERLSKLSAMKDHLPKTRVSTGYGKSTAIIDYCYANFDIEAAAADYRAVLDELSRAQTALDFVNSTIEFTLDWE